MGMLAEREKRLLRTVTGGGQPVGAEPYPGKKGDQGYMLAGPVAERIQRRTQQGCADRLHIRRPPHTLRRRARGEHTRSPPRVQAISRAIVVLRHSRSAGWVRLAALAASPVELLS